MISMQTRRAFVSTLIELAAGLRGQLGIWHAIVYVSAAMRVSDQMLSTNRRF